MKIFLWRERRRINVEKFVVTGQNRLKGEVSISGAKNAAVAIIPATILCDEPCIIENIPNINDVTLMAKILEQLGAEVILINKTTLKIDPRGIKKPEASSNLVNKMRASSYFLGALLGKFHKARVSFPGGCDFGVRPIDQHLKGFTALGATHKVDGGIVDIEAENLMGTTIYMDVVSVGATANIMLAATRAEGLTVIENAAKEPHIVDLANFLNSMGADIYGAGTDCIKIRGVKNLRGTSYSIIPDQIEAGTYMVAAAITNGDVLIKNVIPKHLEAISAKLQEIGVKIEEIDDSLRVTGTGNLNKCNVKTMPYPGFPTDMQPQITVLLSIAKGTSIVTEGVWDNRFKYIEELNKMGTKISVDGRIAVVDGVEELNAAPVKAIDLRAGAAMILAGLAAKGTTVIENIHFIERGYENIIEKLQSLGADIKKVNFPELIETPRAL